ncbi:putative NADH dehydrogenase [Hyphodiscus hymeniophilus]|uniref:NADH dehydrogenase n=1 Tax=Hyphodiscus hymeniophilus TaxID=353542 RepID=A0A9P7AY96_9HELO|nr:putative NADH dehydrogenase [Hyphodiscus hymeniophilus]
MSKSKQSIVIIGSGWAGSTLSGSLDETRYSITVISPETTTPYTPLLASAACGLYDFSLVETPIRRTGKKLKFIKAVVKDIDFKTKTLHCTPAFPDKGSLPVGTFELGYDIVVIAPGCVNQTFGTPGVAENAFFLRTVKDAMSVAEKVRNCFEKASIPGLTDQQQRELLHFVIVGAGPTGVEVSSELSDLCDGSYARLYPHLRGKVTIAVHDVAENVLSGFDTKLQEYAMASFSKRNVEVLTASHIERVEQDCLYTKEKGRIAAGLVIWATGNKCSPLVESLPVKKTPRNPRILTDDFMRVYDSSSNLVDSAYALGDAADVEDARLPTTAEVACQKANYLAQSLNRGFYEPFKYRQAALVAYLGQNDGVISGKKDYSGSQAWIAWRSKNFLWTRTWRQKVLM